MDVLLEEIVKFIQSSFLTDTDKHEFIERISKGETGEGFFHDFNEKLIVAFESRRDLYTRNAKKLENKFQQIDQQFAESGERLEQDLTERLSSSGAEDITKKNQLFDEYYANLELTEHNYTAALKKVAASVLINFNS